ncbi:hypothetical protein GS461_13445 [Rhodococcus hoagii]|nr:hypothetical protein [Prescottella equi]
MAGRTPSPKTTVLEDDTLDAPQSTSPGDAPADTHDPKERVSSGQPNKAKAGEDGHQTVNAVAVVGTIPTTRRPARAPRRTRPTSRTAPR